MSGIVEVEVLKPQKRTNTHKAYICGVFAMRHVKMMKVLKRRNASKTCIRDIGAVREV